MSSKKKYGRNDEDKHRKDKKRKKEYSSSSSSGSESDEWVEKELPQTSAPRESWMSMTGLLKTYSKNDIKPKTDPKEKKNIDSYNPGTSSRELNPYWKNGGTGVPQTSDEFRKSRTFTKPSQDEDYYGKSLNQMPRDSHKTYERQFKCNSHKDSYDSKYSSKSGNWRKESKDKSTKQSKDDYKTNNQESYLETAKSSTNQNKQEHSKMPLSAADQKDKGKYLSDEKMNKLAAKIVKAEILGNTQLVNDLKCKLEEAREYRKQNPDVGKTNEDDGILLLSTNSIGNSRPLTKTSQGDPRSKIAKKKSETHISGERTKYFSNDDKYNLAQLFEKEKYGNNYDEEAEFAKIASKLKNPNDDLEDIFTDEISKNKNAGKEDLQNREKAIRQHVKMQRSLDGCQYCLDSKRMLKHLMVSCSSKVYLSLPQMSLVEGHCIISTTHHVACVTAIDEDVWEEILDYRKALTKFYNSSNQDVVFFETAVKMHKYPHLVINCVPMPRDVGDTAPIYFKKALLECESEWAMNKKVVDLKGRNIRRGVPKGLPYFWVDFGMDPGFAHVIEDQTLFPKTFAEEIIGGILDLDHSLWKNPKRDHGELQRKKVMEFHNKWKPFDTVSKRTL